MEFRPECLHYFFVVGRLPIRMSVRKPAILRDFCGFSQLPQAYTRIYLNSDHHIHSASTPLNYLLVTEQSDTVMPVLLIAFSKNH